MRGQPKITEMYNQLGLAFFEIFSFRLNTLLLHEIEITRPHDVVPIKNHTHALVIFKSLKYIKKKNTL